MKSPGWATSPPGLYTTYRMSKNFSCCTGGVSYYTHIVILYFLYILFLGGRYAHYSHTIIGPWLFACAEHEQVYVCAHHVQQVNESSSI